jgi:hypothetical protein
MTMSAEQTAAIVQRYGPGKVFMVQCDYCGNMWWNSSHNNEPPEVVVTKKSEAYCNATCSDCDFIAMRFPELGRWVINVVGHRLAARGNAERVPGWLD